MTPASVRPFVYRIARPAASLLLALALGETLPAPPVAAQGSLLDPVVSPDPPADEAEDPGFPVGENPIDFFDAYSWKVFLALNWPAEAGKRGMPDRAKGLQDVVGPRVWETWMGASDIYLPNGAEPPEWDAAPPPANPSKTMPFTMVGPVFEEFNQGNTSGDPIGPLVARNRTYVRYEIRVNRKQFDAIRSEKFYLRKTLLDKEQAGSAVVFPDQSIEIKAAWMELKSPEDLARKDRFYHVRTTVIDSKEGKKEEKLIALIGFHIGQKTATRRQWIWSTFEHAETAAGSTPCLAIVSKAADASPPPGPLGPSHPMVPDPEPTKVFPLFTNATQASRKRTEATNLKWQQSAAVRNTVWRNYRLVQSQWPTQKGAPESDEFMGAPFPASNVANLTMETYQQLQKGSCISCHFQASPKADFSWFVSLRSFPVPAAVKGVPGGSDPVAKAAERFRDGLQRSMERGVPANEAR